MATQKEKIKNALWGLFIGDALAMPAHWYYNTSNIPKYLGGPVAGYLDPPDNHVEAFMVGGKYRPDVEKAKSLGRKYDILHDHLKFYDTTYNDFEKSGFGRDENGMIRVKDRFHYHYGLKAGENTLNAHLVRVLMRQVIDAGKYDRDKFLDAFVAFMTTPGKNKDPHTEGYLRAWFENYTKGLPPDACANNERDNPGINALGGLIRPLVVSLLAPDEFTGLGLAHEHQVLTHRSEHVSASLSLLVPVLNKLAGGDDPVDVVRSHTAALHLPKYNGVELLRKYNEHGGMGKVPLDVMWKLHAEYKNETWDIAQFDAQTPEKEALKKSFSTACYPEHGVPMLLYLAWHYKFDFSKALLANVNAGGDNVHRGMVLGVLLGAVAGTLPDNLVNGLADHEELEKEIEAFAEIAVSREGL